MHKRRNRLTETVAIGVCVLCLGFAVPLRAQDEEPGDFGGKKEAMFEEMIKELDLSAEQQAQIRQFREKQTNAAQKLRQKLRVAREELRKELEKETVDEAKLKELVAQIKEFLGELVEIRVKGVLDTKSVLSPEQFTQLMEKTDQMRKEHRQRMKENFSR